MHNSPPILLAEDDENDIFLMRRAFREGGLLNQLRVVQDGREAISYLEGEGAYANRSAYPWPCLLLLDLRMPLANGFDVLAWLQRRRRPKELRVIILSNSEDQADLLRAFELGADDYWIKPQDFEELLRLVRGLQFRLRESPALPAWLGPTQPEGGASRWL